MSKTFITSKKKSGEEVLEEAGLMRDGEFVGELPQNFKSLWQTVELLPTEELLEQVAEQLRDAPGRRREVLTAWMAQELGYSRVWRRKSALIREPLWDVLASSGYEELNDRGEQALAMIGRSLHKRRSFMHPSAALATLALWRHSDDEELRSEAERRLENRALPDEPEWLYEVVGVFLEDADKADDARRGRSLSELVELALQSSYWEVAALIPALVLVHRYGRWYHSAAESNLVHACDVASQQYPHQARRWLEYMVDAAIGGRLSFSWLEEPVKAAIRLSLGDQRREKKLRKFLAQRRFDSDHRRLNRLYKERLKELRKDGSPAVRQPLLEEVRETARTNPSRALRLLELVILYERGRRVGSRLYRLRNTIDGLGSSENLDELESWLIGMYVYNATLAPHAAALVRRAGDRVDWDENPFADRDDYEMYLVISDYEFGFEQLTCKFEGVTLEHADKYAAARIKHFVQKRVDPSRIHRLVQKLFAPLEWIGSELSEIDAIQDALETGMDRFEARLRRQDLRQEVVDHHREAGVQIEDFDAISGLPVDRIDMVLRRPRNRRLLLGAVAGGVAGGLAPYSKGALSIADVPIMLGITADICGRYCWYYGFDPREHRELPLEILAVALGGTRPEAVEPMLARESLHGHVMRKSLVVAALTHGGAVHLAGRGLTQMMQRKLDGGAAESVTDLARQAMSNKLGRRQTSRTKKESSPTLPIVGGVLGAALNASLLYDISEAAQAVLTDRFLERKYPDWVRHFSPKMPLNVSGPTEGPIEAIDEEDDHR